MASPPPSQGARRCTLPKKLHSPRPPAALVLVAPVNGCLWWPEFQAPFRHPPFPSGPADRFPASPPFQYSSATVHIKSPRSHVLRQAPLEDAFFLALPGASPARSSMHSGGPKVLLRTSLERVPFEQPVPSTPFASFHSFFCTVSTRSSSPLYFPTAPGLD